jgi:hypothetical protein
MPHCWLLTADQIRAIHLATLDSGKWAEGLNEEAVSLYERSVE